MSVLKSFLSITSKPVSRFQSRIVPSTNRAITIMSRNLAQAPRQFAALNPDRKSGVPTPNLDGIVFDVDGTLCEFYVTLLSSLCSVRFFHLRHRKPTPIYVFWAVFHCNFFIIIDEK